MRVLSKLARWLTTKVAFYENVLADPETPRLARWCIVAAIAYLAAPIDLIPDFIPLLGQLDDIVVVGVLLSICWLLTPRRVFARYR